MSSCKTNEISFSLLYIGTLSVLLHIITTHSFICCSIFFWVFQGFFTLFVIYSSLFLQSVLMSYHQCVRSILSFCLISNRWSYIFRMCVWCFHLSLSSSVFLSIIRTVFISAVSNILFVLEVWGRVSAA